MQLNKRPRVWEDRLVGSARWAGYTKSQVLAARDAILVPGGRDIGPTPRDLRGRPVTEAAMWPDLAPEVAQTSAPSPR